MPDQEKREFEYMYIGMNEKWNAEELDSFIESINTIYNSFYIMNMISNNDIHEKVVSIALKQMERYRAIEALPQWIELRDSVEAAYRVVPPNESRSMKMMFTKEIFKILEQYVDTREKLSINSINHGSPGGTEFKAPKPIRRSENEMSLSSPLEKTQKLIDETFLIESNKTKLGDIVKYLKMKRDEIVREFMLENRTIDPQIMEMIKEILVSGPLENLTQLGILRKVSPPKMRKKDGQQG